MLPRRSCEPLSGTSHPRYRESCSIIGRVCKVVNSAVLRAVAYWQLPLTYTLFRREDDSTGTKPRDPAPLNSVCLDDFVVGNASCSFWTSKPSSLAMQVHRGCPPCRPPSLRLPRRRTHLGWSRHGLSRCAGRRQRSSSSRIESVAVIHGCLCLLNLISSRVGPPPRCTKRWRPSPAMPMPSRSGYSWACQVDNKPRLAQLARFWLVAAARCGRRHVHDDTGADRHVQDEARADQHVQDGALPPGG